MAAIVAAVTLIAGCVGGEREGDRPVAPGHSQRDSLSAPATEATTGAGCEVGGRPEYFVPGGSDGPFAIIGRARLGISGKPVELSADYERIAHGDHVCLDPAYRGRGRLGTYIPAVCVSDPVPSKPEVVSVEVPRQAVRGYQLVIWGTAGPSARRVMARHDGRETRAALFAVRRPLARDVGATRPFSAFVVELYPEAACQPILVRVEGVAGGATRVGSRPRICRAG